MIKSEILWVFTKCLWTFTFVNILRQENKYNSIQEEGVQDKRLGVGGEASKEKAKSVNRIIWISE